jgi:uncharacterized membrane protein HdeD (DUF308 family)
MWLSPFTAQQIAGGAPEDTYGGSFVFTWFIGLPLAIAGSVLSFWLARADRSRPGRRWFVVQGFVLLAAGGLMLLNHLTIATHVIR